MFAQPMDTDYITDITTIYLIDGDICSDPSLDHSIVLLVTQRIEWDGKSDWSFTNEWQLKMDNILAMIKTELG